MKQFLCISFLAVAITGCSDNKATVDEDSKTTINKEKGAVDAQPNMAERGGKDVDVDTIGMAEFLALKAGVAAKYKQAHGSADEDDADDDTTGFTEFKRLKAKTAPRHCDCEDSLIAAQKKSGNAKNNTSKKVTQQKESGDEDESSDQTHVAEDSIPTSRNL